MIAELVNYGSSQFKLDTIQSDGSPLRDHLTSAYSQSGILPEELDFEPLDADLFRVWGYFASLGSRRRWGDAGPQRITWGDLQAWQSMARSPLERWELKAVLALDDAFVTIWFENK